MNIDPTDFESVVSEFLDAGAGEGSNAETSGAEAPSGQSPQTTAEAPQTNATTAAPAEQAQTQPVAPPTNEATPEQIAAWHHQQAQQWDAALDQHYSLDAADLENIPEPVALAFRKLLKKAHNTIRQQAAQDVMQAIPHIFEHLSKQKETGTKAVDTFFSQFPDLNKEEFKPTLVKIAKAMSALEWDSNEERIAAIGNAARAKLKLPNVSGSQTGQASPAVGNFTNVPVSSVRSNGGASPATPAGQAQNTNLFADILQEFADT